MILNDTENWVTNVKIQLKYIKNFIFNNLKLDVKHTKSLLDFYSEWSIIKKIQVKGFYKGINQILDIAAQTDFILSFSKQLKWWGHEEREVVLILWWQ